MSRKRLASERGCPFAGNLLGFWFAGAVLAGLSGLLLGSNASAESATATTVEFNIPAQPVSSALRAYAHQAKVQLLVMTEGLDAIQANAVVGRYDPHNALHALLAGTGLQGQFGSDSTVMVQRESDSSVQSVGSLEGGRQSFLAAQTNAEPYDKIGTGASQTKQNSYSEDTEEPVKELEEIFVTGSRIRGAQGASPVVSITRQEINRSGIATVEELVDSLPQNFGGGASQDNATDGRAAATVVGGSAGSITAGTSVNLRGLGTSSTLVLLNGRRLSSSGADAKFVDISSIPLSAIERVEVLTDGASAIYGADSIAGVVNFILRDDYEGAESRLRYASDTGGDTSEAVLAQTLGRSWDGGNILVSYEYYRHGNLANVDREVAASSDLRRFGGDDWRPSGGNPANIIAGGQTFAIPAGQDGTSLTAADFVGLEGTTNRHDVRANEDFLPEQERHSVFATLSQHIGAAEFFAEARFSARDNKTQGDQGIRSFDVPNTNPFFVDPTGTGLTTVRVEGYSVQDDLGPFISVGETDAYGGVLGMTHSLGGSWKGELVGTFSKEEATATFTNFVNSNAFDAALTQTDSQTAFNPFGDGSHTSPAVIDSFRTSGNGSHSENELWTVGLNFHGDAFRVPGGAAKVAAGLEFREESLLDSGIAGAEIEAPMLVQGTDRDRDVLAIYTEFFFPLIGSDNSRPGVNRLEFSLAGRYEDYSDFGSSIDPKLGIVWSPTQSLTLRGTLGTSFKAPGLPELETSNLRSNFFFYFPVVPLIPFETIFLLGGNENLVAETATTWTAGFQLAPKSLAGLFVDVTYFNIDFEDRIERPFGDLRQAFDPRFATVTNSDPTLDEIAAVINDPRYLNLFGVPDADLLSGAAPVGAIIDGRVNNLAESVVTGVEAQVSYQFDTALGDFDIGLNGSYLFDFERALIEADPLVDEVDTLGRPVEFRARGSMTWSRQGWTASGFLNYTDGYTDNVSDPHRPIDSWTTVDVTLSYDTGDRPSTWWRRGLRLSLSAQNLFDENPPFANSPGGLAYDSANANGRGQFLALQVSKEW